MRIDKLLVDRGLAESREKAQALIMAGDVIVEKMPVRKAGTAVDRDAEVRVRERLRFVGRGGTKLEGALDALRLDPAGWVTADIGASTGGFTHCLLTARVRRVFAVDVDTRQLDWRLRNDPRVRPVEGNARYMTLDWLGERVDLATVDVSFISLRKVMGAVSGILHPEALALLLVKPQFELGRDRVGRGGVVTDPVLQREAVDSVLAAAPESGLAPLAGCRSPIKGKEGNQEFFVLLERRGA